MLPNGALYAISASKDNGFRDVAICELENDFVWALFDFGQLFAESDVLDWDEAGHDFEQVLSVSLANVSGDSAQ